jgi:hypothetical protein
MVRDFRRRFLMFCAVGLPAGALAFFLLAGWKSAAAYGATFVLVTADFLWLSLGLEKALGKSEPGGGLGGAFLLGMLLKTLLLLLGLYGILTLLPQESLGVIAGIGVPLMLLAVAGAIRTRG